MSKYLDDLENICTFSPKKIADYYKRICEVYAERLCEMYEWCMEDCHWVSDEIGGTFCSPGAEISISMDDIRFLVDNCIPFDDYYEFWTYNLLISYAQKNEPDNDDFHYINMWHWFHGCPRVDIDELRRQETIYWNSYKKNLDIMCAVDKATYEGLSDKIAEFEKEINSHLEENKFAPDTKIT